MQRWQRACGWCVGVLLGLFGCRAMGPRRVPPSALSAPSPSRPTQPAATTLPEPRPPQLTPPPPPTAPPAGGEVTTPALSPSVPLPAQTPPSAPAAPSSQSSAPAVSDLHRLHRAAVSAYASIECYSAKLTRREHVNGKDKPTEALLFRFRKHPWSVYFKWLGPEGRGREVVYVRGQHDGKIHTLLAAGDMPFMPAGKRFSISPDSMLVRSRTRYPITEAGVGRLIEVLGGMIEAQERGDYHRGTLQYLGPQQRPEFAVPVEGLQQTIPPGAEPAMPRGGRRWVFFSPENHLPVLLVAHDERGHEVEYYLYEEVQNLGPLGDEDFNPDRIWANGRR